MFANIKAGITDLDSAALCLNVPYGYNHGEPIQGVDSDGIVPTLLEAAHLIG